MLRVLRGLGYHLGGPFYSAVRVKLPRTTGLHLAFLKRPRHGLKMKSSSIRFLQSNHVWQAIGPSGEESLLSGRPYVTSLKHGFFILVP